MHAHAPIHCPQYNLGTRTNCTYTVKLSRKLYLCYTIILSPRKPERIATKIRYTLHASQASISFIAGVCLILCAFGTLKDLHTKIFLLH